MCQANKINELPNIGGGECKKSGHHDTLNDFKRVISELLNRPAIPLCEFFYVPSSFFSIDLHHYYPTRKALTFEPGASK